MTQEFDFSKDELEAVRDYTNRVIGTYGNTNLLEELHLWDNSRKDFNDRGKAIKEIVVGSRNGSPIEMDAIYRWNWGTNTREGRIALEQELLNIGLAWIDERGGVRLTGRGQMLSNEAYFRER